MDFSFPRLPSDKEHDDFIRGQWDKVPLEILKPYIKMLQNGPTALEVIKNRVRTKGLDPDSYIREIQD